MLIKWLEVNNFRCFKHLSINLEEDINVIVAENGSGKSAVLDAIAIALSPYLSSFNGAQGRGFDDYDAFQVGQEPDGIKTRLPRTKKQYPVVVRARGLIGGETFKWERLLAKQGDQIKDSGADFLREYGERVQHAVHGAHDEKVVLPVIAYYGTARLWQNGKVKAAGLTKINLERDSGYYEAFEPPATYQSFVQWFQYATLSALEFEHYQKETGEQGTNPYREVVTAVKGAVAAVVGNQGWRGLEYSVATQSLVIVHEKSGALPIVTLSDGVRSIIGIVADIAYRMVRLNPDLGSAAVLKTPGIVLIDEVDMHLHPSWQQSIIADLRRAFPLVQFILTTHSPQVLTTVPATAIKALRWHGEEVEVFSPEFSLGAESYQLLQEIQNVETRPKALPIVKTLMRYLELVSEDKWDTKEAKSLRKELDAWGKDREPALIKADMDIRMRAYRRGLK
ncbi:MAG TPA: AAA family ATPase [Candidatus Avacidaminococcus intestinavium]|uniref:AAA family ATPase n=1 Tax=Candidatus Avacidaminococcus intestinavium TaxID=2840684 RepID=A0A9D1MQH4_9FIRM|nr:AAA family ATPase [Candidatus Avacidaminococcus intestinavium]